MSCYVKTKGVYYPISEEKAEELECLKLPENFHIEGLDDGKKINYYMSYELRCEYDTTSDDFGRNRFLTEKERSKYVPKTKYFQEDSRFGVMEGYVKFVESK